MIVLRFLGATDIIGIFSFSTLQPDLWMPLYVAGLLLSSSLTTSTVVDNVATIVFDWNPPIDNPKVFNIIDAQAHMGKVSSPYSNPSHL